MNLEIASPRESAIALTQLSDADLRRLEQIARLRVIGLYDLDWRDLLHEAVIRLLDGSRKCPRALPLVVFLRETMRSIASDHWRRRHASPILLDAELTRTDGEESAGIVENSPDLTADPEREISAAETLAKIEAVFRNDSDAIFVIGGMASGKSPNEIQEEGDMTSTQYASTQRRIRRTLTRAFPERREP